MPDDPDNKGSGSKRISRKKEFEQDGVEVTMPDCEAEFLVSYLYEIGPAMSGGMGESPLTHGEIEAWQRNTGIVLDTWQVRTLKNLSHEYLAESQNATKPDAPAPWLDAPYLTVPIDRVALKMQQAMLELSKL